MAFNIAVQAPIPIAQISFNAMNISVVAPMPVAAIGFASSPSFAIGVDAPLPVADIRFNGGFHISVLAPMPFVTIEGHSVSSFNISVVAPMPIVDIEMGQAWVIKANAPIPTANIHFVTDTAPFQLFAIAPFPVANISFGQSASEIFTVLVMNLKNKVVSLYENYNFNSACKFNGVHLGAASDGIHILSGADDNGDHIDASITLGDSDFGLPNVKIIPELFFNYSGSDGLQVYVALDQDEEMGSTDAEEKGPYPVPAPTEGKTQTKRAKPPGGFRAGHWQFRIENTDGSDFNLQSIEMPVEKSNRRLN